MHKQLRAGGWGAVFYAEDAEGEEETEEGGRRGSRRGPEDWSKAEEGRGRKRKEEEGRGRKRGTWMDRMDRMGTLKAGELCCSAAMPEGTEPLVQSDEGLWHGEVGAGQPISGVEVRPMPDGPGCRGCCGVGATNADCVGTYRSSLVC